MGLSLKSISKAFTFGSNIFGGPHGAKLGDPLDLFGTTAREYNSAEAAKQRNFEKQMSDTAHQREVADLKAAGLNPILSAGTTGASTPSGSSAATTQGGSIADIAAIIGAMVNAKNANTARKQAENEEKVGAANIKKTLNDIKTSNINTAAGLRETVAKIDKLEAETEARRQQTEGNKELGLTDNDTGIARTASRTVFNIKQNGSGNLKESLRNQPYYKAYQSTKKNAKRAYNWWLKNRGY